MGKRPICYLAGPEVFLPDAATVGRIKLDLCDAHGFQGLFPLDGALDPTIPAMDDRIYAANVAAIRRADVAILNLTPFRGHAADAGTVFELGLFIGLGKPVFAYTNDTDDLVDRLRRDGALTRGPDGVSWLDQRSILVEDFGNADNLMIDCALRSQGRTLHRHAGSDPARDIAGFVACLGEARASLLSARARPGPPQKT